MSLVVRKGQHLKREWPKSIWFLENETASARGEEVYTWRGNSLRELKTISRNWRVIENCNLRSSDKSAGIPVINQIVQLLGAPPPNTLSMTSTYL